MVTVTVKTKKYTLIVLAVLILIYIFGLNISAQSTPPSAISIWHFDENYSCNVSDETGINNGKLKPNCPENSPKWVTGKIGYALEFDGIDDYVDYGTSTNFNLPTTTSYTYELWVKIPSSEIDGPLIAQRSRTSGAPVFGIYLGYSGFVYYGDGEVGCVIRDNDAEGVSNGEVDSNTKINDNNWHNIVCVRDADTGKLTIYVDGVQRANATDTTDSDITTDMNYIGNDGRWVQNGFGSQQSRYLKGTIDEVRIYGYVLSDVEVWNHYQNNYSYIPPITTTTLPVTTTTKPPDTSSTQKNKVDYLPILIFSIFFITVVILVQKRKDQKRKIQEEERRKQEEEREREEDELRRIREGEEIRKQEEERSRKKIGEKLREVMEEERKKKGDKQREFETKKEKLRNLEHDYIGNFVRKYYSDLKGKHTISDLESKLKLKELLSSEDIEFSDEELNGLISEEIEKYEYKQFREKIISANPASLDDYIRSFLEYCGDSYQKDIDKLQKLLAEMEVPSADMIDINERIGVVKKKIELDNFKKKLVDKDARNISMHDIDSMSGYEFEGFLEELFRRMGYSVKHTKLSGDQGGDLIISKFGEKIAVQAKRSESPIGNKAIQEVLGAMKMYGCDKGMVVTNNDFTTQAMELADKSNVELIDGDKLEDLIREYM